MLETAEILVEDNGIEPMTSCVQSRSAVGVKSFSNWLRALIAAIPDMVLIFSFMLRKSAVFVQNNSAKSRFSPVSPKAWEAWINLYKSMSVFNFLGVLLNERVRLYGGELKG